MIRNRFGVEMFGTNTRLRQDPVPAFEHGQCASVVFRLPMLLDSGAYGISFAVHGPDGNYYDYRNDALVLEVIAPGDGGGLVRLPTTFEITRVEARLSDPAGSDPLQLAFPDAHSNLNLTEPDARRFLSGGWSPVDPDFAPGLRLTGEGRIVLGIPTAPNPPTAWRLLIVRSDNNAPAPWPPMEVWAGSTALKVGTPSPDTKTLACTISLPNLPASRILPIRVRLREAGTHLDIQSISLHPDYDTGD
jgi:hypothetical protein